MTVPTVTIVPPQRDRLTYAVSGGTVVAASIVTPPSPHRHLATGDGGVTMGGRSVYGNRPPRIRLTYAVFAFGGRWGRWGRSCTDTHGRKMIDNAQLSIFDDPGEEDANADDRIRSEGEVFEIARARLGRSAPDEDSGPTPAFIARSRERRAQRAGEVGLVARWSKKFGFVSIHDPNTGEWHDVGWKVAPSWARWEARKRKDLGRTGDGRAYDLPASEIRGIWEAENPPAGDDGIVEDHPVEGGG